MGSVTEYDDRPGPLHDQVLHNEQRWRERTARAVQLAIDAGHLRPGRRRPVRLRALCHPARRPPRSRPVRLRVARRRGDAARRTLDRRQLSRRLLPPTADRTPEASPMATPASTISTIVRTSLRPVRAAPGFRWADGSTRSATLRAAGKLFTTPFGSSRTAPSPPPSALRGCGELDHRRHAHRHVYVWGDPRRQPYVLFAHGWSSHGTRVLPWVPRLRAGGLRGRRLRPGGARTQRRHAHDSARLHLPPARRGAATSARAAALIGHSLGGAAAASRLRVGWRPNASC